MPRQEAKVDLLPQKAGVVAEKDGARLVHEVRRDLDGAQAELHALQQAAANDGE